MTTTLKPNPDGGVTIPKELLGDVGPGTTFHVAREGKVLRLEPAPRKLHEIADPEERTNAFGKFIQGFTQNQTRFLRGDSENISFWQTS